MIVDIGILVLEIDYVVFVGGLIWMFVVIDLVKEFIGGKEFNKGVNFDEVVVVGVVL